MISPLRQTLGSGLLGTLVLLTGCATSRLITPAVQPRPLAIQVGGLQLGAEADEDSSPERFLARCDALLRAGRPAAVTRQVALRPDLALLVLNAKEGELARNPALIPIAAAFDRLCTRTDTDGGWLGYLRNRQENEEPYTSYDRSREAVMALVRTGNYREAADEFPLTLPKSGPARLTATINAARCEGGILLLAGKPRDAAEVFRYGIAASRLSRPYETALMLLMLCEAEHRAGRVIEAHVAWIDGVETAGSLLRRKTPVSDPNLWQRTIDLRPAKGAWPIALRPPLEQQWSFHTGSAASELSMEVLVWSMIAEARLERGENRAALLAFSQAEGLATEDLERNLLRLGQAKALLQLKQNPGALGLLNVLASNPQVLVSLPALATLGALDLRLGLPKNAIIHLDAALANPDTHWPDRAAAQANLGIAYLRDDKEEDGLRCLRAAATLYTADGDLDGTRQCLENELLFMESQQREVESRQLRGRIERLAIE